MFADVSFSTESLAVIFTLMTGLSGAIVFLFKLLLSSKDTQIKSTEVERDSYKEIAEEAIKNLEISVNQVLQSKGKPRYIPIKPVVPEHSSPITVRQQESADIETAKARLAAASLILGIIPEPHPVKSKELIDKEKEKTEKQTKE